MIYYNIIVQKGLEMRRVEKRQKLNEETLKAISTLDEPKTVAKLAKILGISNRATSHRIGFLREGNLIDVEMMCKGRYGRYLEIKGEIAEDYLYEFVNAHRGLSIYELSKRLGWSTGKVYNIIKVLEEDGLVRTIKIEERGRMKRKVYPVDWKELLPEEKGK